MFYRDLLTVFRHQQFVVDFLSYSLFLAHYLESPKTSGTEVSLMSYLDQGWDTDGLHSCSYNSLWETLNSTTSILSETMLTSDESSSKKSCVKFKYSPLEEYKSKNPKYRSDVHPQSNFVELMFILTLVACFSILVGKNHHHIYKMSTWSTWIISVVT